jgi:peptide/nickel transport system substrate-binding protein
MALAVAVVIDPQGTQGWLRPNWLHPPFNNQKARQALLHAMDPATSRAWAVGQSQYYRTCYSIFPCGTAYATEAGADAMIAHHIGKARQLVKDSGVNPSSALVYG